jgi:hypothetical protein
MKIIVIGSDSAAITPQTTAWLIQINYNSCQHFSDHRQLCRIEGLFSNRIIFAFYAKRRKLFGNDADNINIT